MRWGVRRGCAWGSACSVIIAASGMARASRARRMNGSCSLRGQISSLRQCERDCGSRGRPQGNGQAPVDQQNHDVVDQVEAVYRDQPQQWGPEHQVEDLRDCLGRGHMARMPT